MLTLWLADKILSDLEGEEDLKLTAIETAKDELMDINRQFAANNSSSDINNARLISCIQWELYGIIYA